MNIGIYGGTFNPPHLGHFQAAKTAIAALKLDKLILIPAALPPHKELPEGTPSPERRLEMTVKMADAMAMSGTMEVSDLELRRPGKSYTADTLEQLHRQYPQAKLWLLMGTDMFLTLHLWREPERIMALAGICAFGRTEQDGEELFSPQRAYLKEHFGAEIVTITLPGLVDISSTRLRAGLDQGLGRRYLVPAVYGCILMNSLYGVRADLKHLELPELRACSYYMMKQKRVPHVMGVEEEAAKLARRWGADETLARRAGALHDCTKYWTLEENTALCAKYGVELERTAVKLLHSKTGACIAKYVFGEPEEVCQAIFWHTTAKEDMTLLEKIIYMADYIEPNRDFAGVERLRALSYKDLDKALLLGVETTIQEMEERGLPIHKRTLMARDWLLAAGVTIED